jgi:hypothetical protein
MHANGSDNDIRCHVAKLAINSETRGDVGIFLAPIETRKNGIAFRDLSRRAPRRPRVAMARASGRQGQRCLNPAASRPSFFPSGASHAS